MLLKTNNAGALTWRKTLGGPKDDYAYSMVKTYDGGYMLAGSTQSYGAGGSDFWILKTDQYGNMKGQTAIGGPGNETAYSVIETYNDMYVMAGKTNSYGNGSYDVWLVKTTSPDATTTTTIPTTTTTSTTTTTTLSTPCSLLGDYPPCGVITMQEVINFINAWIQGEANLADVVNLIIAWSETP